MDSSAHHSASVSSRSLSNQSLTSERRKIIDHWHKVSPSWGFFSFQGITAPREDWYWPKANSDEEEDDLKEEDEEEEEVTELTVSILF